MFRWSGIYTLMILLLALVGCAETDIWNNSDLLIDNGLIIDQDSVNTVPAVFEIGGCTAQAVSHNTVLTAAHCVQDGGRVTIRSGKFAGSRSNTVRVADGYHSPRGENYAHDVALAVFDDNTFDEYFLVRDELWQPAVGETIHFVGYSGGAKRWGSNKVSGMSNDENVESISGGSSDGVAVSPGDSGGIISGELCNLLGVASRMTISGRKKSLHARPSYEPNHQWILDMASEGAYVCGIHGMSPEKCALKGIYFPALKTETKEYSCRSLNTEVKDS